MTPIDPPPGLLDKMAERVRDELKRLVSERLEPQP